MEQPVRPGTLYRMQGMLTRSQSRQMAVHTLGVGLVVVGSNQQQSVRAHVLVFDALLNLGCGAVGAAAYNHGNPAVDDLDSMGHHGSVLLMAHGRILAGGAQGQDGVGAPGNLAFQELGQHLEIHAAVLVKGGNHCHNGALHMVKFHIEHPPNHKNSK